MPAPALPIIGTAKQGYLDTEPPAMLVSCMKYPYALSCTHSGLKYLFDRHPAVMNKIIALNYISLCFYKKQRNPHCTFVKSVI